MSPLKAHWWTQVSSCASTSNFSRIGKFTINKQSLIRKQTILICKGKIQFTNCSSIRLYFNCYIWTPEVWIKFEFLKLIIRILPKLMDFAFFWTKFTFDLIWCRCIAKVFICRYFLADITFSWYRIIKSIIIRLEKI